MKKKWTKIVALLSTGMLFLTTGCAGGNGSLTGDMENGNTNGMDKTGSSAKGRYVETALEGPSMKCKGGIYALANGGIAMNNEEAECLELSMDEGLTWTDNENAAFYGAIPETAELAGFCAYGDGAVYATYIDWDNGAVDGEDDTTIKNQFIHVDAAGNVSTGSVICENDYCYLSSCVASEDGRIFVQDLDGKVYEMDLVAGTMSKIFETNGLNTVGFFACGNYLIAVDGDTPYIYDLTTEKLRETDSVLADFLSAQFGMDNPEYSLFMAKGDEADTIYIACNRGLYRHAIGGTVMEQLIDGALTSLGDTSKHVNGLIIKKDGNFLMSYSDGMICSYDYNADIPTVPETEIKIYSLYENATMRQAISTYQKKYMDIYLNYEVGISGDSGMTESDAIKNLNTEMMAGEGPDILILDGLPVQSYQEKGMLLDLSDTLETIEQSDSCFENILEAYATKEGTFALPFRFDVPILAGKNSTISNISTIADLEENLKKVDQQKGTLLGTYTEDELLELLYMTASAEIVTQDGSIDEEKLTQFLEQAKSLYELESSMISDEDRRQYENALSSYTQTDGVTKKQQTIERLNVGIQTMDVVGGTQAVVAGLLEGKACDQSMVSAMLSRVGDAGMTSFPGLNQTGTVFLPSGIVGISSKSNYIEESKEFLTVLFSNEVQQVVLSDGYPVNIASYQTYIEQQSDLNIWMGASAADGSMVDLEVPGITTEDAAVLMEIIQGLHTPANTDSVILDAVLSQGEACLNDEMTVEEAVNSIMQTVGIYAKE